MISLQKAFYDLIPRLATIYGEREATAIAHEWVGHITQLDKFSRLVAKESLLTNVQYERYLKGVTRLLAGEPLQYVTGIAWFMGRPYSVSHHVLIPRPETEELVSWVLTDNNEMDPKKILDVGTGSGCIPISLKLKKQHWEVQSCDISEGALTVASHNAQHLSADIQLFTADFLNVDHRDILGTYDIVVSNPPYIPQHEKERLDKNVRDFEPGTALFVPDSDALVFYRAIAEFGQRHLTAGGAIYCEVEQSLGPATADLFRLQGYEATLRKDMHDNWRMIKAWK